MEERSSSRASGTTYHSFNTDLFEPPSPPRPPVTYDARTLAQLELLQHEQQRQIQRQHELAKEQQQQKSSSPTRVQRQDSGYESITPTRRSSNSNSNSNPNSRPAAPIPRKSSNASSTGAANTASGRRTRPSFRRSAKNALGSYAVARNSNQSLHIVRTNNSAQPTSFFHFPTPDPIQLTTPDSTPDVHLAPTPAPTPPPQTTHYWTSDRTRRLEYAAIDAATRGVKGWVLRNLVPDCFIPRDNRHVSFDDDSGSVRRYRLELEEDTASHFEKLAPAEKGGRRRKGWRFWRRRKNMNGGVCTAV